MRFSLPIAVLATLWAVPAIAQVNISTYTDVNLDACSIDSSDDMGSVWTCPGYKGIPVMIAEGDLRFFVSYGLGPKLEWRLGKASGDLKPFATILRYYVQREEGEDEGQILVVTKVAPGATCHVAYVDALANPKANEMAQKAADDLATDFDCASEPEIVGAFEAWER
jgi:hypothetical protein